MMSTTAWGATYTWNQTGSAAWTTAGNWTPTRTTPDTTDLLVIDGDTTPSPTLTAVPSETIGGLWVIGANATLTSTSPETLTIVGGTGSWVAEISTLTIGASIGMTLSGTTFTSDGTVSGAGTFRTQGSVTLVAGISFSPPLEVNTGTTTAHGSFDGTISVAPGATLQASAPPHALIANANVTVNGPLSGVDGAFIFNGSTFTNNGSVTVSQFWFSLAGAQSIAGTGTWTGSSLNIESTSTTSLSNAVTFAVSTFVVSVGSTLSLGGNTLTVSAGTAFSNSGTVSGAGTFRTQGGVTLVQFGSFSPPLEVNTGTTTGLGSFDGTILVAPGATLTVSASGTVIANANVTVNGTLSGGDGGSIFTFNGSTFTNNNSVTVALFQFRSVGAQSLAGTGTWTGSSLTILDSSTTSLSNAVTFAVSTFTVNSGCTLSLGSNMLTFVGTTFTNSGTVSGAGTFRTQGSVTLHQLALGTFSSPLEVNTGTTTGEGSFDGTISVDAGATLTVRASWTVTANADVTVNGTLSGADSASTFTFNGSTFTNNGSSVTVPNFNFGDGVQTLTGTGSFSSNTANILFGSTLTLGSDHQMSTVVINVGGTIGTMDITSRTLLLSGSGTPLTNNGTLTTTGSTIAYNGSSAQTVATDNVDYNNLTINNAAGVSLSAAETVSGTLTLTNGKITTTASNLLTLGSAATMSGGSTSSFVDGPMAHTVASTLSTAKTFPVGKGSAYRPATLTVTQDAATATAYTGEVFNSAPPSRTLPPTINNVSTVRYWTVTKGGGAGVSSAAIKLDYGTDDGVTSPTDLRVVKDTGSGDWADLGGTGSGAPTGSITSTNNFTSFSDFTLGSAVGDNPLPVELSAFTVTSSGGKVALYWRTESESNNLGFHLYRSTAKDGEYVRITSTLIKGHGTDSTPHDYSFLDETAEEGQTYWYLIEYVDFAGVVERSEPIQVIFRRQAVPLKVLPTQFALFQNFPNPFNPETWIPYQLAEATAVEIRLYEPQGRAVRELFLGNKETGYYKTRETAAYWDGRDGLGQPVVSGIYFYQIKAGDFMQTRKLVIVR